MKTVYLLRHAKSKHDPEYATDFERPLAKRGRQEARYIGEWMADHGIIPDLIISSPAERAQDTVRRCAQAADYQGEIRLAESLYISNVESYVSLLEDLDDSLDSVMLVGHNPDISEAVEALSGMYHRMPTGTLACIDLPIQHWIELSETIGQLTWVQEPIVA